MSPNKSILKRMNTGNANNINNETNTITNNNFENN